MCWASTSQTATHAEHLLLVGPQARAWPRQSRAPHPRPPDTCGAIKDDGATGMRKETETACMSSGDGPTAAATRQTRLLRRPPSMFQKLWVRMPPRGQHQFLHNGFKQKIDPKACKSLRAGCNITHTDAKTTQCFGGGGGGVKCAAASRAEQRCKNAKTRYITTLVSHGRQHSPPQVLT